MILRNHFVSKALMVWLRRRQGWLVLLNAFQFIFIETILIGTRPGSHRLVGLSLSLIGNSLLLSSGGLWEFEILTVEIVVDLLPILLAQQALFRFIHGTSLLVEDKLLHVPRYL